MNISASHTQSAGNSQESFWAALGLVRFCLAIIVLEGHIAAIFLSTDSWIQIFVYLNPRVAVLSFLLISGYSIAHSFSIKPGGFLERRGRRIFSVYWPALLISFVVMWIVDERFELPNGMVVSMPTFWQGIGNFLLLQEFLVATTAINAPLWSISIEWWNYVITPRFSRMSLHWLCVLLVISAIGYCLKYIGIFEWPHYKGHQMVILGWSFLLGFVYFHRQDRVWAKLLILALPASIVIITENFYFFGALNVSVTALAIVYAKLIEMHPSLRSIANYLGDLSYPIYVLHWPVCLFNAAILKVQNPIVITLVTLLASILLLPIFNYLSKAKIWKYRPLHTPYS